ncbi:HNH endonuclease [Rhizobium sp. ZK1]|uniref:HNH endonuclease n=1 Tax=Rhizobium sp. ZK1 TaxID=3389872 RepID=UPI0039F71E38
MPFVVGQIYNRVADIHGVYNGQQRSGIITPADTPVIFIVSGEEGRQHGYADRWRDDGVFEYFGQGQIGDMEMKSGNKAIVDSWSTGEAIHLFTSVPRGLRYDGEMIYERHHYEPAPDKNNDIRDAIVFELRRAGEVAINIDQIEPILPDAEVDLEELRRRAFEAAEPTPERVPAQRSVFARSQDVRDYVLARAGGECEHCRRPGPFVRANGSLYIECHHVHRLSDGGPDSPCNVIGVCPDCHRRAHFGIDRVEFNQLLIDDLRVIEPAARPRRRRAR